VAGSARDAGRLGDLAETYRQRMLALDVTDPGGRTQRRRPRSPAVRGAELVAICNVSFPFAMTFGLIAVDRQSFARTVNRPLGGSARWPVPTRSAELRVAAQRSNQQPAAHDPLAGGAGAERLFS
jgi:hypothetical protein